MMTIGGYFKHCDDRSRAAALECLKRCHIHGSMTWRNFDVPASLTDRSSAAGHTASILQPTAAKAFDAVYVDPQLTTFTNAWSAAFLRQLNRSINDKGTLCLPCHRTGAQHPPAGWSLGWLEQSLGISAQTIEVETSAWKPWRRKSQLATACFSRSSAVTSNPSVLDWWYHDHAGTEQEDVALLEDRQVPSPDALVQRCRAFLQNPTDLRRGAMFEESRGGAALENHFQAMTYSLVGVNYKSALLDHFVNTLLPPDRSLRIIDHGGGFGLVAMELLLEHPRIQKAVNCDPNPRNLMLASRVFQFLRDDLDERFFMHHGRSEKFEYHDRYDLVSFLGALLYLPRATVAETLQRAWNALNPGGLLVIHENIKHRRFVRDYDVMFTVAELNGYLQRFGTVTHFASAARQLLSCEEVGDKTVFRVVQKPA